MTWIDYVLSSDTIAFWLKLVGPLIAMASGVIGLGKDARDESRKLTWVGKVALVGICIGGLFSGYSVLHDERVNRRNTREAFKQNENVLAAIQRGRLPARDLHLSASITLPLDIGLFDHYLKGISALLPQGAKCDERSSRLLCSEVNGKAMYVIPSTSPFYPKAGTEARALLDSFGILVTFSKGTMRGQTIDYEGIGSLRVNHRSASWSPQITYTPNEHRVQLVLEDAIVHDDDLATSKLRSLVDLNPGVVTARGDYDFNEVCSMARFKSRCDNNFRSLLLNKTNLEFTRLRFPLMDEIILSAPPALRLRCAHGPPFLLIKRNEHLQLLSNKALNDFLIDSSNESVADKSLCSLVQSLDRDVLD